MFSWMGLLEASAAGGICIMIFFAVSEFTGQRFRAGYRKAVWLLIALRMCIPVSAAILPQPFTVQVPVVVLGERSDYKVAESQILSDQNLSGTAPAAEEETEKSGVTESRSEGSFTSQDLLALLWGCGCAVMLLYYLTVHFLFCLRMKKVSKECRDEKTLAVTAEIAGEMGLKKIPRIRLVRKVQTGPFTTGFFRNIIFLPDTDYQEKDLQYILRHELAHCRGKDTQIKAVLVIVNALHWFNPCAWLMKTLADQDMELACDQRVLAHTSKGERNEYSEVLMACIGTDRAGRSVFSTGYVQGVKFIKKRFQNIFHAPEKYSKVGMGLLAVLLMGAGVGVGFEAGRMVYAKGGIEIDSGIELRTDVTGDGMPDRIQVYDDNQSLVTSVLLQTADGRETFLRYDDEMWASSYMISGDLSGNGAADIVVMRVGNGMQGTGIPDVLYAAAEGEKILWKEYPRNFLHNPGISMEQPDSFDDGAGWLGVTVIEKEGRHYLRLTAIDEKYFIESGTGDVDTVQCIDCSWQGNGWYIEEMQIVPGYYSQGKMEELLKNNIYSGMKGGRR